MLGNVRINFRRESFFRRIYNTNPSAFRKFSNSFLVTPKGWHFRRINQDGANYLSIIAFLSVDDMTKRNQQCFRHWLSHHLQVRVSRHCVSLSVYEANPLILQLPKGVLPDES
jgi:hypothetical protein